MSLVHWIASFAAAGAIALAAYRARALTLSGALAATLVGGLITATDGWRWGALLIGFFVSSSLLSKLTERRRPEQGRNTARGSRRDAWQVAANGGVATLCAVLFALTDSAVALAAFGASLAAAAADTWATEIGAFSRRLPRLITSRNPVPRGTSGAISPLGVAASIAAALTMALLAIWLLGPDLDQRRGSLLLAITLGGVVGSVTDSLLGATIQVQYHCPACDERTESRIHRCGTPTEHVRGLAFVSNDTVNVTAIIAGAFTGALLWIILT